MDPVLGRYMESEKVPVVLTRNCGILIEDENVEGQQEGEVGVQDKDTPPERPGDKATLQLPPSHPHHKMNYKRKSRRKKQPSCSSISFNLHHNSNQAHKIPVEIRRSVRTRTSKKGWRKYKGVGFGIISSLCFSLTLLLAKILSTDHAYHPICITFWHHVGIFLPSIPVAIYFHCCTPEEDIFDTIWPLNNLKNLKHFCVFLMQGIFGCTAIIFRFYSLEFLTMADSNVITYSSPVFIMILGHLWFTTSSSSSSEDDTKCGVIPILSILLCFLGLGVMFRPPLGDLVPGGTPEAQGDLYLGIILALSSMFCYTGLLVLLRNLRQTHFSLLLLLSGIWGILQSAFIGVTLDLDFLPLEKGQSPSQESFLNSSWVILSVFGLLTFLRQMTIILAFKYEDAGPISVVRSSEVGFAFLWQYYVLGVTPDLYSLSAAGLVILGVILTAKTSSLAKLLVPFHFNNRGNKRLLCLADESPQIRVNK